MKVWLFFSLKLSENFEKGIDFLYPVWYNMYRKRERPRRTKGNKDMKMWFDNADTEVARAHKAAYEKSIKENRCVKVHAGTYYYKGYEISNDGGTEYPWNWTKFTSTKYMDDKGYTASEEHFAATSKKECMEQIDYDIGDKTPDLCDIVCR